jgi:hypothetical protein
MCEKTLEIDIVWRRRRPSRLYVFKTHVASIVTASAFETVSNCPCKTCRRDSTLMSFNYHPRSLKGGAQDEAAFTQQAFGV